MGKLERGRCGLCCTLLVRLSREDIEELKKLGFDQAYFVDKDTKGAAVLRRTNGYCRFLEIKEGIASCAIYGSRPKVCREYICIKSGEEECSLQRHYSVIDISDIGGKKR
jgi:Fe-S-cluster containining protein